MVISRRLILNTSLIFELLNMTANTKEFKFKKQQLDEEGLELFSVLKKKQYSSASYSKQKQNTSIKTITEEVEVIETINEVEAVAAIEEIKEIEDIKAIKKYEGYGVLEELSCCMKNSSYNFSTECKEHLENQRITLAKADIEMKILKEDHNNVQALEHLLKGIEAQDGLDKTFKNNGNYTRNKKSVFCVVLVVWSYLKVL